MSGEVRVCKKCGETKHITEYYHADRGYRRRHCKDCKRAYQRAYSMTEHATAKRKERYKRNSANPVYVEKNLMKNKEYYHSVNGRAKTLLASARRRSGRIGIKCTVRYDDIVSEIKRGYCAVTGIQFQLNDDYMTTNGVKKNPYSPSIDRIDSSKGYTRENTRIVIWQYNLMKGEMSDEEIVKICERVVENAA